ETFEAADAAEVDAVEDHLELAGGQFDAGGAGRGVGEVITPRFQTLTEQAQAVAAPEQDFEPIGQTIAEDEQGARQRVSVEPKTEEGGGAVEAEADIDGLGAVPQLDGGGEAQHGWAPNRRSKWRRVVSSAPAAMRRTAPLGRTSSSGAVAGCRRTGSRRGPGLTSGLLAESGSRASAARRRFQA